jgi:hypothetical protein
MSDQEFDRAVDELAVSTWKYAQMTDEEPTELRLRYWKTHLIHMLRPESSSEHYRLAVVRTKAEIVQPPEGAIILNRVMCPGCLQEVKEE